MLTSTLTSWTLLRSQIWASKVSWRKHPNNYRAYPRSHWSQKWVSQLSESQHHLTTSWEATTVKSTRLSRALCLYMISRVPSRLQVRATASRLVILKQQGISSNQVKTTFLLIKVSLYRKWKEMTNATRQGRTRIEPAKTKMSFTIFWWQITNHKLIAY